MNLTRTTEGGLLVEGVVDTEHSKKEILQALSSVRHNPAVKMQVNTSAEVLKQKQGDASASVILREFAGSEDTLPVHLELRHYFAQQRDPQRKAAGVTNGSPEDEHTNEMVRSFAARVVSGSRRALSHAIELKRLAERFSPEQLRVLTPEARTKWLVMLRDHSGAIHRETSLLRKDLQPIFFPLENPGTGTDSIGFSNDDGLLRAIERLYKLVLANDEAVRSAFTASSGATPTALTLKASQFRSSLAVVEELANRIRLTAVTETKQPS